MPKKSNILFPRDGDLRGMQHFLKNTVLCVNNKDEIIVSRNEGICAHFIRQSWPLFFCLAIFYILDWLLDSSQPAKVCMSCVSGLILVHFANNPKLNKIKHKRVKLKSFVNSEEDMSKVNVNRCSVEIRYVKMIKKKWKFKVCVSLVDTEHQWREWRSFDELVLVQSQLLKDVGHNPDLTPQCRSLLKTPLVTEDQGLRGPSISEQEKEKTRKSSEEVNAELRHKQVSFLSLYDSPIVMLVGCEIGGHGRLASICER